MRSLRSLGSPAQSRTSPPVPVPRKPKSRHILHELRVHQEELEAQNEELRETQQLLEASRDRYADLYDFAPIGYATLDGKGHICEINLTGATILGQERSRLLGMLFSVAVVKSDLSAFHGHLRQCRQGSGPVTTELTLAAHDRNSVPVQLHSVPIPDLVGQSMMYRTAITDITEAKQAEKVLRLAHDELEDRVRERTAALDGAVTKLHMEIFERGRTEEALRELSIRLLHTQDEERGRIARELHDSTGQNLAVLAMNLSLIGKSAEALDGRARKALTESLVVLNQSSRDIRTLSYLLHPPLLDERGLAPALRCYMEGFTERSDIRVDLEVPDDLRRFPQEIEMTLFRIVQEGLTNAHRHSGTATARIQLHVDHTCVLLEVQDAGKGFAARQTGGRGAIVGVGIAGMRERVQHLGGQMEIESNQAGTTIRVTLPLNGSAS